MSKRTWRVFFTLVGLFIFSALLVSAIQSRTSFKELVLEAMYENKQIHSIHLTKGYYQLDNQGVEVTDSQMLKKIMDQFADIRLRRCDCDSPIGDDSYTIYINPKSGPRFQIYYDGQNMKIGNSLSIHKKYAWTYKIVSDFDASVITDLVK